MAQLTLQLDGHLDGIKETFKLLSQELDLARRERDDYKAQLDSQAKELDDFRKRPQRATFENKDQTDSFTATSPEYHSPLDEVGQSVDQESDWYTDDESAGSPASLDDSNNEATSEKLLDLNLVYTLREEQVMYVNFSPDGKHLATVCRDGATKIYETETGNNVCVLIDGFLTDRYRHEKKSIKVGTACFSPDNVYLATSATDCKIRIWEIGKKGIRNIFKDDSLSAPLDFLSNGRFVVSASGDSKLCLWNMRTGTPTIFKGPGSIIMCVRSSPDSRYIAAGTSGRVVIWDIRSRAMVKCSLEHPGFINDMVFTQDGMSLVTGSRRGTWKLWDISSLKGLRGHGTVDGVQCLRNFDGTGFVLTVALSHDGQWILSGSIRDDIYFWDTRNGKRQCVLHGQVPHSFSAFSPAGDYLAVGNDKGVQLYTYRMI